MAGIREMEDWKLKLLDLLKANGREVKIGPEITLLEYENRAVQVLEVNNRALVILYKGILQLAEYSGSWNGAEALITSFLLEKGDLKISKFIGFVGIRIDAKWFEIEQNHIKYIEKRWGVPGDRYIQFTWDDHMDELKLKMSKDDNLKKLWPFCMHKVLCFSKSIGSSCLGKVSYPWVFYEYNKGYYNVVLAPDISHQLKTSEGVVEKLNDFFGEIKSYATI